MNAVAFPTGAIADDFLLIRAFEVEPRHVATARYFAVAEHDVIGAAGDLLEDRVRRRQGVAVLIDVGNLHALPDRELAIIGCFLADDHAEERGLPRAVRADHADDAALGQVERQVVEQQVVAVGFFQPFGPHHQVAEHGAGGDLDRERFFLLVVLLCLHFVDCGQTGLALGHPRTRGHLRPLQFAGQFLLAGGLLLFFHGQAAALLVEPTGVVALPRNPATAIEFQNVLGDVVQEVPVVCDGNHGPFVQLEVPFEPLHGFGIQVVGRFVQEQQVGLLQQHLAQRHPPPFPPGKLFDGGVRRRQSHRVHRHLKLPIEVISIDGINLRLHAIHLSHQLVEVGVRCGHQIADFFLSLQQLPRLGNRFLHVLQDRLAGGQVRFLRHKADRSAGFGYCFAHELLVHARHDFEQRRFARPVATQHANFCARIEGEVDLLQDLALAEVFREIPNRVNVPLWHAILARR